MGGTVDARASKVIGLALLGRLCLGSKTKGCKGGGRFAVAGGNPDKIDC